MKITTTAIICALNEEKTIVKLLSDVISINYFDELIVIDDGSTDTTGILISKLRKKHSFKSVHFLKNHGKGYAMARGVEMSNSEIIVFIDADLSNFIKRHANHLVAPIISGRADMVLGQPSETLINRHINPFKQLTGQRALKKADILPLLDRIRPSRYGVETIINLHFKSQNKVVRQVCLLGLVHPTKFEKTNLPQAIKEFASALHQILKAFTLNADLIAKPSNNKSNKIKVSSNKLSL